MGQQSTELKLTVPWGHIAAKTYGSSTGKCVLMVHGILDNLGSFTRLINFLPMEFYYVCIDLPGHGYSSHFPSWMTLDILNYVYVIFYVLEALQWKTCIYIGHSLGAQIGIIFSILQPYRIEKIITLDGIISMISNIEDEFLKNFKEMFTLPIKVQNNIKSRLYTKEQVLYALKYMRYSPLNSDAAEALFERSVIKIGEKYMYIRDIRLKRRPFTLLSLEQCIYIVRNLSVPLYFFIASNSMKACFPGIDKVIESINRKSLSQFHCIQGNHNFHNNYPEKIAPFICKILQCENSSKL